MAETRATFLRRGAGGLVLASGAGAVLAAADGAAWAATSSSDVELARAKFTAESLAVQVYGAAIASRRFTGGSLEYLRAARADEREHAAALRDVLGRRTPQDLRFTIPERHTTSAGAWLRLGEQLEAAFVASTITMVERARSAELRLLAAQLLASESSHWSFFRAALRGPRFAAVPALPRPASPHTTARRLRPFLGS